MIEHEQIPPKLIGDVAVKIGDAANYFKYISSNAVKTPFGYMQLSTSILDGVGYQLGRLARFVCKDALIYRTLYIRGYEYIDFERNSEQKEREEFLRSKYNPGTALLNSLLPLLKEADIDPQEFALSGNIFAEGMINSVELGRIMRAQPQIDLKDVGKGKVVWWRDTNDNTFYYRVRQQPYPRKYMNSYGLHENIVGGYGEMVIQTSEGSTYALDKCVVQGATNGGPTWGMLGPRQISKNIGVIFYQPRNDWRESFTYFKSAPVASFGILDPSKL